MSYVIYPDGTVRCDTAEEAISILQLLSRRVRWTLILVEALRFAWCCRQRNRGLPWSILPIPPRAWVTWRLDTAYGEGRPRPPWRHILDDVCTFFAVET